MTVFNDLVTPNVDLREWQEAARSRRLFTLAKDCVDEELKKNLCVIDAKSLFDHLSKETVGVTEDKRTAIEMQLIRQSMAEVNVHPKWVPHPQMAIDVLTKRVGNRVPL